MCNRETGEMPATSNTGERPSVFVGSSTEGVGFAKAIQVVLDESCEVELWSQGVFGLSEGTLESLISALDRFDFAVLVLSVDDLIVSRGEIHASARDNVLFELGLFIGRLGRERTFIVFDRTNPPKLPSDLAGVTTATFQPHASGNIQAAMGAPCTKIEQHITRLGPRESTRLRRLSKVAADFEVVSADAQDLLSLLARSRAVELGIISEQFGMVIEPAKLDLILRDLRDLEERLADKDRSVLSEAEQEILFAASGDGAIVVIETDELIYPFLRVGGMTLGDERDVESLAAYWNALKSLEGRQLVEHVEGNLFRMTANGFVWAKRLVPRGKDTP
jgi:predicted nucleotide-binding protein